MGNSKLLNTVGASLNAWRGPRYEECGRVLIMCESTYGMIGPDGVQMTDQDYVPHWCARPFNYSYDPTFAKLCKGSWDTPESRPAWWSRVAFCNLWPHDLGSTNADKVSDAQLRAGAATLPDRLKLLDPLVVWVASVRSQPYALPAIRAYGARVVISDHPARASYINLAAAWAVCVVPSSTSGTRSRLGQSPSHSIQLHGTIIMSKDTDAQQRLWLSLGYGGKKAPETTWRYWPKPGEKSTWIIAAPNGLATFEQRGKEIFLDGKNILCERTPWLATWGALAYFYKNIVPTVPAPQLGRGK